jgi:hypothetical protein
MSLPEGWTLETPNVAMLRAGEPIDVLQCGRVIDQAWPFEATVTFANGVLEVDVDDDSRSYTSGSATSVSIPVSVLKAIGALDA